MDDEGASLFNKIYQWVKEQELDTIVRTPSGGISIERRNFKPPMFDVRKTSSCIELTLVIKEGSWRIQFRTIPKENKDGSIMYGNQAFKIFRETCLDFGIDLADYEISNGEEVKTQIEKTMICLDKHTYAHKTFEGVHHIDFHNSFPAGLVNTHPEFKDCIEYMYDHRKEDNNKYKFVLNASIGYMQSTKCCNARWAHLSRDAINDNNKRIRELSKVLVDSGRMVIAYNTDGIWYKGDVYHGEGEGSKLGQWENDHLNCKFRAKSSGAYEFIEDGVYTPVVRGFTRLDKVKPRNLWNWGEIYRDVAEPLIYNWTEYGITRDGKLL